VLSEDIVDVKVLGQGTFGQVWEVQCKGARMAFKRIHTGGGAVAAAAVAKLLREARSMAAARHPNVIALLGVSVNDPFRTGLLTEVADGGTLRDVVDRAMAAADTAAAAAADAGAGAGARRGSGLPVVFQLKLAREVVAGVVWLHANTPTPIVHRDMKVSASLQSAAMAANFPAMLVSLCIPRQPTCL
jgi:serine/threonine protein kinase